MFLRERSAANKYSRYIEHSYRVGSKVKKVSFYVKKGRKIVHEDLKLNDEVFAKISDDVADYIAEAYDLDRFYSYGEPLRKIEKARVVFELMFKRLSKVKQKEVLNKYLDRALVDSMRMEGGTINYDVARALSAKKVLSEEQKELVSETDRKLYLQLRKAWNWLEKNRFRTAKQLKDLHGLIYKDVFTFAGEFKTSPNTFGGIRLARTAEPRDVRTRVMQLMSKKRKGYKFSDIIKYHIEYQGIHPFEDGNSRLGRLIMAHQMFKAGYPPIIMKESRSINYRNSLVNAINSGNFTPFTKLVVESYFNTFEKYWKKALLS